MRWDVNRLAALQAALDAALREYEAHCYAAQQLTRPGHWHIYWGDEANYARWFRASVVRRVQSMLDFAHGKDVEVLHNEPRATLDDTDGADHTGAGAGA